MLAIHTILHPTDFSDRSGYGLQMACALSRDYNARLVVLHVAAPPTVVYGEGIVPPDPQIFLDEAKNRLNRLEVPGGNVRAERRFEQGDPATEILRVAKDINADLIVMGTHGRTGLSRALMGSVAEQVVRKAPCPVLSVTTPIRLAADEPARRAQPMRAADAAQEATEESVSEDIAAGWMAQPRG